MNDTHDTATAPMGKYHFPSENGPGTSLSLPEVIRRNMGVTYDVYRPMTAELCTISAQRGGDAEEEDAPSERRERGLGEAEHAADAREDDDEPHAVDGRLRVRVDALPPARAGQRVVARECEDDARGVDDLRGARHVLRVRERGAGAVRGRADAPGRR